MKLSIARLVLLITRSLKGITAVPMGHLWWFLFLLIVSISQLVADVATDLMKWKRVGWRIHFLTRERHLCGNQSTEKRPGTHWEETARFLWCSFASGVEAWFVVTPLRRARPAGRGSPRTSTLPAGRSCTPCRGSSGARSGGQSCTPGGQSSGARAGGRYCSPGGRSRGAAIVAAASLASSSTLGPGC
jgi:hypothetical protein